MGLAAIGHCKPTADPWGKARLDYWVLAWAWEWPRSEDSIKCGSSHGDYGCTYVHIEWAGSALFFCSRTDLPAERPALPVYSTAIVLRSVHLRRLHEPGESRDDRPLRADADPWGKARLGYWVL